MKTLRFLPARRALAVVSLLALGFGAAPRLPAFPSLDKLGDIQKKADDASRTAGNVAKVAKGATGLSLEEEIAIGDAVAVQIVERFGGVWRDAAATRRVNLLGRGLARYAQRQDLEWRFGLLNSDSLNAFSAPGGRVFITRGLYKLVASDDELAGALAHEIAHVDRRHALKIIARGEALGGVAALVKDHGRGDFAQYDDVVKEIVEGLFTKGFDPNTEFDADKYGRELARTTGFAAGGLRAVVEKLQAKGLDRSGGNFSTHPPAGERLQRLPKDPAPPPAPAKK